MKTEMTTFEDEFNELMEVFDAEPQTIIGLGKNRPTDLAVYNDRDQAKHNAKYGLASEGDPLEIPMVFASRADTGYHYNLEEGFDLLSDNDEADDINMALAANEFFNPSGFNQ